jgi:hypothetical protein
MQNAPINALIVAIIAAIVVSPPGSTTQTKRGIAGAGYRPVRLKSHLQGNVRGQDPVPLKDVSQCESGMLSTNQVMKGIAVMFIVAAGIIWIA